MPQERIRLVFVDDVAGSLGMTFGHALSIFDSNFAAAWNVATEDSAIVDWTLIPGVTDNSVHVDVPSGVPAIVKVDLPPTSHIHLTFLNDAEYVLFSQLFQFAHSAYERIEVCQHEE